MSMRSRFKAHRRRLITHTSAIVGFVLLTTFVAEPLFDRLEKSALSIYVTTHAAPVYSN
jgi:hypothetical protein